MASNTQELLTPIRAYEIINDDITQSGEYGNYYVLLIHNLDIASPIVQWYDNLGNIRSHTGNIRVVDNNSILVYTGGEIVGTHKVLILQDKSNMLSGRRLFDQPLLPVSDIDETYRFAIGRPGFPTKNITLRQFADGMGSILGQTYLRVDNNLSDLGDAAIARSNLSVYSKDEMDARYLKKTDSNNLNILSDYVPASYPGTRPLDSKTILTYALAQHLEHSTTGILNPVSAAPWTVNYCTGQWSELQSCLRFTIIASCSSNVSEYNYTEIASITDSRIINKLPQQLKNSKFVYACEGMPKISSTITYPASTSHMQVEYNDNKLSFKALATVAGRTGLTYIFNGTLLLVD